MAAPRRETLGCLAFCLLALAVVEYAIIAVLVKPLPSDRFDWYVATGYIAPMLTAFLLWLGVLVVRITYDALKFTRWARQWITKNLKQQPHPHEQAPTPSYSSASAAPPSSSCGWPSAGSSYTSRPGPRSPYGP
jgi:hypothetical protein